MSRTSDASKRIPRPAGNSVINSRALVLNAIFANKWPSGVARPTLAQIRAVLMADAAMTKAQRERDNRVTAGTEPHVTDWQTVVDRARKET